MSSSTMHESFAIRLRDVSKIYKLHGSQSDQLIDVLGLQRFGIKTKTPSKEFSALSSISLDVPRGHRIGIVGRNGAGKTTLLKLICGNFAPTSGKVEVNGTIQALMNIGLGFHPEYTGRENVEASLQYNGLARDEYKKAIEGIIDFCELGDFLDQPFKTYSLGMQARLMFAAATAIRPDILIVDEVLGAGDAYFVAKSKSRVERLVASGCTMLLVSHSMQQVLELCDEAIWLDKGAIRMRGESFTVVKAYEEFLHGPIADMQQHEAQSVAIKGEQLKSLLLERANISQLGGGHTFHIQEPTFLPHAKSPALSDGHPPSNFDFVAPGGVSRWDSTRGVKFCGFTIQTERGLSNKLVSMRPARFLMTLQAEVDAHFQCRYAVAVYNHLGQCVLDIVSPADVFVCAEGGTHSFELIFNPLQLGPGEYVVSISAHEYAPLELFNSTPRYDLMSRSFVFSVELPETLRSIEAQFYHSAEWHF
ncbi:ABC transporter related [Laribacter hongkongensis HLHK9]|uniref:ABC transporter related n=1 Tax=Laribacter hongkongensis (strain HLHK9) TaxID=557598 RepID=C1DDE5_LARHH|nr:ABC transporter ATP-binding protein [Laribacter hongkongensis]ACO75777.1 ABC transporter related [Laribacter hongkongensis HLHK9]